MVISIVVLRVRYAFFVMSNIPGVNILFFRSRRQLIADVWCDVFFLVYCLSSSCFTAMLDSIYLFFLFIFFLLFNWLLPFYNKWLLLFIIGALRIRPKTNCQIFEINSSTFETLVTLESHASRRIVINI